MIYELGELVNLCLLERDFTSNLRPELHHFPAHNANLNGSIFWLGLAAFLLRNCEAGQE